MIKSNLNKPTTHENPSYKLQIIRLPSVMQRTGLSRSSIYAYMQKGYFPAAIKLGERSVGWLDEDITSWLDSRITATVMENSNA